MQRADALTVSRTLVEVSAGFATMIYRSEQRDIHARVVLPLAAASLTRARCS
jgi:hypothetical protein